VGHAVALHLLGDIATHPDRFDAESGEAKYQQALVSEIQTEAKDVLVDAIATSGLSSPCLYAGGSAMKCPRCQQENPSQTKFCLECATPLALQCTDHSYTILFAAGRIPWVTTKRSMQCPTALLGQCGPSAGG
jgi:hypothetical protein